jgi:thioesterase domain-containing protein
MARDYLSEIRQVQPHGPYLLGGFSGGGLAMFEAAHQLLAQGEEVAALVMLDAYGPRMPTLNWPDRLRLQWWRLRTQGVRYVAKWARDRAAWEFGKVRRLFEDPIEPLTPAEFRSRIVQQGFAEALAKYEPRVYPGRIYVFRPHTEAAVHGGPGRVLCANRTYIDPQNFWGPFTTVGVEVHVMPGNHDAMVLEPQVRVLAARLTRVIEAALARSDEQAMNDAPHEGAVSPGPTRSIEYTTPQRSPG